MYEIYCNSLKRNNFACYDDFLDLIDSWQEKYKVFKEAKELLYELNTSGRCSTYCKERFDKVRNVLRQENYTYKAIQDKESDKSYNEMKKLKSKKENIKIKCETGIGFKDLLSNVDTQLISNDNLISLKQIHPNQLIGFAMEIPIWKIEYSYESLKGNKYIKRTKFIYSPNNDKGEAEMIFYNHIKEMNRINPHRIMRNVEIIRTNFMGLLKLPIGNY